MPRVEFEQLPEDARVWIFSAERTLTAQEQERLLAEVDTFLAQWVLTTSPSWRAGMSATTDSCSWRSTSPPSVHLDVLLTRSCVK